MLQKWQILLCATSLIATNLNAEKSMSQTRMSKLPEVHFNGRGISTLLEISIGDPMMIGSRWWDVLLLEVRLDKQTPCRRVQIGYAAFTQTGTRLGVGDSIASYAAGPGEAFLTNVHNPHFNRAAVVQLWLQCDGFHGPHPNPLPPLVPL